jgi:predicted RNase H-like nuclease
MSFVAGVDGCRGGWIAFKVELPSHNTSVEKIDLAASLRERPPDLVCIAIDIPIGLLDDSRKCDTAARRLLRWPRRNSVFTPPCRAAIQSISYDEANAANKDRTGRGLNVWAWGMLLETKNIRRPV